MTEEKNDNEQQIIIHKQYIKDLSFENPDPLNGFDKMSKNPKIDINVGIEVKPVSKDHSHYEVCLDIRTTASANEEDKKDSNTKDNNIFILELQYAGIFSFAANFPEKDKSPMLGIYAPSLLFPYARQKISDITINGGYSPVMLQPIDFAAIYRQKVQEEQDKQEK